ncbi:MAG: TonB-dependent receptor, partial [Dokdonella sp.]
RGPQGTLYGSGALGGAVRFILREPDLDEFSGRVSLSGSSVNHSDGIGGSGSATVNIPLASSLALRLNTTINDFPGVTDYRNIYVLDDQGTPVAPSGVLDTDATYRSKKDADFVKQSYGRASLLFRPNDTFDMTLSYMAQADQFGGRRGTSLGNDGFGVPYRDLEVGSIQLEPAARHVNLTSLEANIDLGFATLTSSTSDYDHVGDITSENTGFYAQNGWLAAFYYNYPRPMASAVRSYGDSAFTQEFRLTSNEGERFDYVLGAYYQNQKRNSSQDSFLRGFKQWWDAAYPAFASSVVSDQDYLYRQKESFKETALYGELTWHATDTVQFTGGFRHFRDESVTNVFQTTGSYAGVVDSSSSRGTQNDTDNLFKGNVSWRFSPKNQLYATISEGYRRGGTNGTPTTGNFAEDPAWTTYQSDTVRNYEFGVKGALGQMTYNANVFYVDWKNPQINSATTNWGFFAVQNADKASTRGIELELAGFVGDGFGYGLGYTYTQAELESDALAADGAYLIGFKGDELPGSPKHRINANASYGFPMASGYLTFRGDIYHQTSMRNALSLSPRFDTELDGFTILNASMTYSRDSWDTTLWIKNITNADAVNGIYTEQYMGTSPAQNYFGNGSKALVTLPRTVGVTASYRF